jgi:hypothetical protein
MLNVFIVIKYNLLKQNKMIKDNFYNLNGHI